MKKITTSRLNDEYFQEMMGDLAKMPTYKTSGNFPVYSYEFPSPLPL